jgi:hypothetical protein
MNRRFALSAWGLGLLLALVAAPPAFSQAAADKTRMYEDIEIMGRILDRALKLPRYSTMMVPASSGGMLGSGGNILGGIGGLGGLQGGSPMGGFGGGSGSFSGFRGTGAAFSGGSGTGAGFSGFSGSGSLGLQGGHMVPASVPLFQKAQGIYVKDHGVIFTVVLPPQPDPKPAAPAPPPKQLSEWERIEKQLHGEKTDRPASPPKQKQASIADTVLEALAENGHRFSQLSDKESLTVSVIFRSEAQENAGHALIYKTFPATVNDPVFQEVFSNETFPAVINDPAFQFFNDTIQAPGSGSAPPAKESTGGSTSGDSPRSTGSSPRDYELLGDLHVKQGQSKEALKAYQKAAEQNADAQHRAGMYLKIAHLYLTAEKNETEAKRAMDRAREILAGVGATKTQAVTPNKPASPLPSRLTITVSKRVLDMVGSEKISMDDFKKAAVIDYLSFDAAKKAPEGKDPKARR